ncbi:FUSC family protein [Facilibium subflavum]|uniref:FUSC family protein n=1 Tax=Facilibium subflavum TaxID=2219058 RepID=UPI000E64F443|nr:FUSC family protein [Facilibium subflavum]
MLTSIPFFTKRYAIINAFKASVASLIAYFIGLLLGTWLQEPRMYTWIVITVLVIMSSQPNLGGALDKALMRMLGTIIGAAVSIISLLALSNWHTLQILVCLIFIFIGVYVATTSKKYTYVGVLGAITVGMILMAEHTTITFALYRSFEVLLGACIALLTNRYLLPIKASKRIIEAYKNTVFCIQQLHQKLFQKDAYENVLSDTFSLFSQQIALQKEIKLETKRNLDCYKEITHLTRRLYRYVCVVYEYIHNYPQKHERFSHQPEFIQLHNLIDKALIDLANNFHNHHLKRTLSLDTIQTQLEAFKQTLNLESRFHHASTLIFSLETIITTIKGIDQAQKQLFAT